MENFRLAVKSFVVKDGKVLLIKRRPNDSHKPDQWDIPGGRLEIGENPVTGLKRETKEEVNIDIEVVLPLDVHHFVRDDGQKITMIIFLCKLLTNEIKLSEEHQEHKWVDVNDCFSGWLKPVVDNYLKYVSDRF